MVINSMSKEGSGVQLEGDDDSLESDECTEAAECPQSLKDKVDCCAGTHES